MNYCKNVLIFVWHLSAILIIVSAIDVVFVFVVVVVVAAGGMSDLNALVVVAQIFSRDQYWCFLVEASGIIYNYILVML